MGKSSCLRLVISICLRLGPTLVARDLISYFDMFKIRSSIMGIFVFISQEVITYVIRRASEGSFKDGLDNNRESPWNEVVNKSMFNSKKKGAYSDLTKEKKLLLKIQNGNLLHVYFLCLYLCMFLLLNYFYASELTLCF